MRVTAELVDGVVVVTVDGLQHLGEADHAELAAELADAAARCLRAWLAEEPPDPRDTAHDLFERGRAVAHVAVLLGIDPATVREWKREGRRT